MDDFLQFPDNRRSNRTDNMHQRNTKKGGFNLTKFFSNDSSFPLIDNTERDTEVMQRVFGQKWDVKNDTFIFRKPILDIKIERLQQR